MGPVDKTLPVVRLKVKVSIAHTADEGVGMDVQNACVGQLHFSEIEIIVCWV